MEEPHDLGLMPGECVHNVIRRRSGGLQQQIVTIQFEVNTKCGRSNGICSGKTTRIVDQHGTNPGN